MGNYWSVEYQLLIVVMAGISGTLHNVTTVH